ncbi:MAG TPA: zf-HC2 domain-containing protein [Vicinamibacterales bacterium]|jgi:anti-sigma factor RsiW|nr:zf-HC2 domain-containing protein [Vicinamibacterales bacterium]
MNEIRCASGVDLLMDYLEGVLSADVYAAVEAHVAGCPRCIAFIASYRETPRIMREATSVGLAAGQQASLLSFLRAQRGFSADDN